MAKSFNFECKSVFGDDCHVFSFKGKEGISKLFEFEIVVGSTNPDIQLDTAANKPAKFSFQAQEGQKDFRDIHGIISEIHYMDEKSEDKFKYHVTLVPKLWLSTLSQRSHL